MNTVTITETIWISRPPEVVWDFTQDYSKRTLWDKTILEATIIGHDPRHVRLRGIGGLRTELLYKLDDRPRKTSLAMVNTVSPVISGGGGSWQYQARDNGTFFTQTNSLVLKANILTAIIKPIIKLVLRINTRKALKNAKILLEL